MTYPLPNPRASSIFGAQSASDLQSPSVATTSSRFSVAPAAGQQRIGAGANIYDRSLNKARLSEVSASAFAFLFSEIVQYTQKRVSGIGDLERRLGTLGYRIGTRVLELMVWRAEGNAKAPKREIRFLPALMAIHSQVWKACFGKPADGIEKSVEKEDECKCPRFYIRPTPSDNHDPFNPDMIIDNDPPITRYISVPKDMDQLSCSALTAGIVEAVLDGLGFLSTIGYTIGLGAVFFASALVYSQKAARNSNEQETAEPYGDYFRSLNETATTNRADTEWLNMGYWKNTTVFPDACEDVGHATGESLLLHLTHPEVPRPSSLFGITSLKFQHDRAVARIMKAPYPNEIKVQLYLGDAVYRPVSGTPSSPKSSVQTMRHPLEPNGANNPTHLHPSYTSIIALDCAYHFRTREQFLAQSARSLVPGGSIALADMCLDTSTQNLAIHMLRRLYYILFSINSANMITMQEYKETMERLRYENVIIEDISVSVFPGFIGFLQKRGVGWWVFTRMVNVWWKICGARFIIASGECSRHTGS
ncbi:TRAPP complex subunit trs31 [Rhizoctonia solani]|uniref:TRAPP complex subunit trs31 n=1 Tax=Rhizoctonia solani TaxID=456999 RepID=A0A8H7HAW7_9AGAM|nr:TRAPP complex subunit trs31 [Rhizoctonia solani]